MFVCRPKSLALRNMSISGSNRSVKPAGKANEIGAIAPSSTALLVIPGEPFGAFT